VSAGDTRLTAPPREQASLFCEQGPLYEQAPLCERLALPVSVPGRTAVWWWRIPGTADPRDVALLQPADHIRLSGIRSAARTAEFITSRARIRSVLGGLLEVRPQDVELGRRLCPCCADPEHGPPTVLRPATPLWIGISHTAGCGMLAVSDGPVGIDVERVRQVRTDDLAAAVLAPAEAAHLRSLPEGPARTGAFLRVWTRKEAVLKGVGIGIATDLTAVETHPQTEAPVTVSAGLPGAPVPWSVSDLTLPGPWLAALARRSRRTRG
jgi:4'-phosphopantetheinyl transferase